jgi:2,3-bisphosphoglycerate-independent phosphoglycerate mutase
MKYAIIIPDRCADEPQASLGGKTPLAAAKMPAMGEIDDLNCTRPVASGCDF